MRHNFLREHIILEREEKWSGPPFLLELHKQINGVEKICEFYWNEVQKKIENGECTLALVNIPWIINGVLLVQDISGLEDSAFIRTDVEVENEKLTNVKIFVGCPVSGERGKVSFYKNFAHELTHSYDYLERYLEQRSVNPPGYDKAVKAYQYPKSKMEAELAEIFYKTSRAERQAIFGSIRAELEVIAKAGSSYWNNIKYCQKAIENLSYIQELNKLLEQVNGYRKITNKSSMAELVSCYEDIFKEVPMHGIVGDRNSVELKFKRVLRKLENKLEITKDRYEKTAAKICADLRPTFESRYYPGRLSKHKLNF